MITTVVSIIVIVIMIIIIIIIIMGGRRISTRKRLRPAVLHDEDDRNGFAGDCSQF